MAHLPYVAARLFGTPLMVHGPKLRAVVAGLGSRFGADPVAFDQEDEQAQRVSEANRRPYRVTSSGIALVPVKGILVNRAGKIQPDSMPLRSYEAILSDMAMAMGDQLVRGVVLDLETPGGEAWGCFDAVKRMAAMRGRKPIIAVANAYAFSAGYAVASAADLILVPESGEVGSIGVAAVHVDESGADAKEGRAYEFIYQGERKVDGNPHAPLSDDARDDMRTRVARLYDQFVSGVAANRHIEADRVRATESRCLDAGDAIAIGLADRIGSLDDAIAEAERRAEQTSPSRGRTSAQSTAQRGGLMADIETEADRAAAASAQAAAVAAAGEQARKDAMAYAAGIAELCATHGRPQDAAAHIAAARTRGEVAEALLAAKAAEQSATQTSPAHPVGGEGAVDPADPDGWNKSIARVCGSVKEA
jgi:ClpP class serine protease